MSLGGSPSPLDLCTLDDAIKWIFGAEPGLSAPNANVIQQCITSLSVEFIRRTGRGPQNAAVPAQSPFNEAVNYVETYTGNGNQLIQLRNWPILSVSSVTILGQAVQESNNSTTFGWYIAPDGKFLGIRLGPAFAGFVGYGWAGWQRGPGGGFRNGGWPRQFNSIQVQYSAGFAATVTPAELQTIPTQPPSWKANTSYGDGAVIFDGTNIQIAQVLTNATSVGTSGSTIPGSWSGKKGDITADSPTLAWENGGPPFSLVVNNLPWLSDGGVSYFSSGVALVPVLTSPAVGQYYLLGNGAYLFNSADAGRQILIGYSSAGTPADVKEGILRWINLIYKRRGWEGMRSIAQKDGGTSVYSVAEVDPQVRRLIDYYGRRA